MIMKYIVKREDICGEIGGYPIEIIQAAVDRGMEQECDANLVIRGLQYSVAGGFDWAETPEGSRFWSRVMGRQRFDIFFQRYPRKFADGVHYFVIDKSKRYWVNVAKAFLGDRSRFAFEGNSGDVFYIVKYGDKTITGFALKDSPRYRWAIENGTKIY
jgi:hypothetical protein